MESTGNGRALRLTALVLTPVYGVVMWFCGPTMWPTLRFALTIATIAYLFVTLARSMGRAPQAGTGSIGNRIMAAAGGSRQFWRLHGGVLMMLGVAELGIRSEVDVTRSFAMINDVLVAVLLVIAAATLTLMARTIANGTGVTAETSR